MKMYFAHVAAVVVALLYGPLARLYLIAMGVPETGADVWAACSALGVACAFSWIVARHNDKHEKRAELLRKEQIRVSQALKTSDEREKCLAQVKYWEDSIDVWDGLETKNSGEYRRQARTQCAEWRLRLKECNEREGNIVARAARLKAKKEESIK